MVGGMLFHAKSVIEPCVWLQRPFDRTIQLEVGETSPHPGSDVGGGMPAWADNCNTLTGVERLLGVDLSVINREPAY